MNYFIKTEAVFGKIIWNCRTQLKMLKQIRYDIHFNTIKVHNVHFPSLNYSESTWYLISDNWSIETMKLQTGSYIWLTQPMLQYAANLEFFMKTLVLYSVKWEYRMLHIAPKNLTFCSFCFSQK